MNKKIVECYDNKNYDQMMELFMIVLNNDTWNYDAMNKIMFYHNSINRKQKMQEYYLKSIKEHNNTKAMIFLAHFYSTIRNYDMEKKYYLMAIVKLGNQNELSVESEDLTSYRYAISQLMLRHHIKMKIMNIYMMVKHKDAMIRMLKNSYVEKYINEITEFIDNSIDEICELCYLETKCVEKNKQYLCGSCY